MTGEIEEDQRGGGHRPGYITGDLVGAIEGDLCSGDGGSRWILGAHAADSVPSSSAVAAVAAARVLKG
jgi:hypothetical protein